MPPPRCALAAVALCLAGAAAAAGTRTPACDYASLAATPDCSAGDALAGLEAHLLEVGALRLPFDVSAEGAVEARLGGELAMRGDGLSLVADGHFGGRAAALAFTAASGTMNASVERDGQRRVLEPADQAAPPGLREAVVVGLVRMGVLHNLARLTELAPPDHASGGVEDWVTIENARWGEPAELDRLPARALAFDIRVGGQPAGRAVLWLSAGGRPGDARSIPPGMPLRREQRVAFPEGEMRVTEAYFGIGAAAPPGGP